MRFFTHVAGGLLLYTVLVWLLNQPYTLAGIMFVTIGSLLPDLIDQATGTHRGWGHSIIWIIPTIFMFIWNTQIGLAFMSGFLMHILFDAITKKGVPFLYPFSKTRIVMPKKEKSRIQTGHKKEIALFIVVVLILIPVSYGVLHGFPEIPGISKNNTNSTNNTNKTNSTPYSSLSSDYRSPSSYSTNSTPYSSTAKTATKTNSTSSSDNITDEIDLDAELEQWLDDVSETVQGNDNQTQNNQNNNNNTIVDGLFGDLSFDNLPEGVQVETNMSMNEDTGGFFSDDSNSTSNNEDDYYTYDDDTFEDNSYDDFFMGLVSTLILVGGGLIGKT